MRECSAILLAPDTTENPPLSSIMMKMKKIKQKKKMVVIKRKRNYPSLIGQSRVCFLIKRDWRSAKNLANQALSDLFDLRRL